MSSLAMSSVTLISTFGSACMHTKSLQLCLTLCDPIDCQAPLFMGILQATNFKLKFEPDGMICIFYSVTSQKDVAIFLNFSLLDK